MTDVVNLWAVEWSPSQKKLHIYSVSEMLRKNQESLKKNRQIDFFPVAFFESEEKAIEHARDLAKKKGVSSDLVIEG